MLLCGLQLFSTLEWKTYLHQNIMVVACMAKLIWLGLKIFQETDFSNKMKLGFFVLLVSCADKFVSDIFPAISNMSSFIPTS